MLSQPPAAAAAAGLLLGLLLLLPSFAAAAGACGLLLLAALREVLRLASLLRACSSRTSSRRWVERGLHCKILECQGTTCSRRTTNCLYRCSMVEIATKAPAAAATRPNKQL
jgi:hypothetical protein